MAEGKTGEQVNLFRVVYPCRACLEHTGGYFHSFPREQPGVIATSYGGCSRPSTINAQRTDLWIQPLHLSTTRVLPPGRTCAVG